MAFTDFSLTALEDMARSLPADQPVHMVNLLRYHDVARYGPEYDLPPCSGREAYFTRYSPAFGKIAKGEDYGLFWVGKVEGVIVGEPGEAWDDIVIVRYATLDILSRVVANPDYARDADPHRVAAVANWKFLVTTDAMPSR